MLRVYNYVGLGIALTAVVSLFVMQYQPLLNVVTSLPVFIVLAISWIALGFFSGRLILTGNTVMAQAAYWTYAILGGLVITPKVASFVLNGKADVVIMAFAITSVTFLSASLFGYVTKRDLSPIGSFALMFVIGAVVAMIFNAIFLGSSMFSLLISLAVVLFFSALTAYETQAIKESYFSGDDHTTVTGKAIFGALLLYGSFITLFIHILTILGILDD